MKCAIILAGGKGTRMKSEKPKVMCEVLFVPMIKYVLDAVKEAGVKDICVITGYEHEVVENYLKGVDPNIKTAFGSRFNGFGTLHNANPNYKWYGPDAFRTTGDDWTDNYLVRPSYITSPIELMEDME